MSEQELFPQAEQPEIHNRPLADRMRPRTIDEFVGQEKLLGKGRLLRAALENDRLFSMILWGPPGCGKTALAMLVARHTRSHFEPFSAVLGGVKELRHIVEEAERRQRFGVRTVLFIDEIHRWNKAQQDALLPHVEKGTVVLIGATTENPSFELIPALLSRCQVLVLEPLTEEQLALVVKRALEDGERGLGRLGLSIDPEALKEVCRLASGDARRALNILEAAASHLEKNGGRLIELSLVREAAQTRTLLYDRAGEEHYNVVSAFIKSLRGSDPHAAVYWMARMLEVGEDPRFILRRMVIFAAEDIGNADPQALQVAVAASQAHELVGLPESVLCLTQAATYLACAPKSNSALLAYSRARADVKEKGALPVPLKLRNAPTELMRQLGYGKGYRYPHNYEGHYVAEDYLPEELRGRRYYEPSDSGFEKVIRTRLEELERKKKG